MITIKDLLNFFISFYCVNNLKVSKSGLNITKNQCNSRDDTVGFCYYRFLKKSRSYCFPLPQSSLITLQEVERVCQELAAIFRQWKFSIVCRVWIIEFKLFPSFKRKYNLFIVTIMSSLIVWVGKRLQHQKNFFN